MSALFLLAIPMAWVAGIRFPELSIVIVLAVGFSLASLIR